MNRHIFVTLCVELWHFHTYVFALIYTAAAADMKFALSILILQTTTSWLAILLFSLGCHLMICGYCQERLVKMVTSILSDKFSAEIDVILEDWAKNNRPSCRNNLV